MTVAPTTGFPVLPLEVIGTAGFAVSGAMAATRKRMDVFGVIVLGVIVAVGGGTLRDLLLAEPVTWLTQWWPLAVAAGTALATIPLALRWGPTWTRAPRSWWPTRSGWRSSRSWDA